MQRVQVTVSYDPELEREPDVVILRPVHLVAAERHYKGNIPGVEGTLWAAWYALRIERTFADWLDDLEGIAEEQVPPSLATAPATSPTSP